jgi:uncharacterized integral membrane protein (TIGR00698 family)
MSNSTIAKERTSLHEDWAVVVLGFFIIFISFFYLLPVPAYGWKDGAGLRDTVLTATNLAAILTQFLFVYAVGLLGAWLTGKSLSAFARVFPVIALLTLVALVIAGNSGIKGLGLEAVIFSLSIGLLVSNTINLPTWFRMALTAEMFVKIGLVLLGTTVIFTDILKAGSLGLIQALLVVVSVWYFAFWVCKKFKLDDELTMMLSSAVSICGVSAAIATAGAIKGDTKKLSYIISLVLITAIPMMIFMPYIARYFGFPEAVTGAWLGGSIDTTGAVVASGTLVGETALKISTIVKFSQNVLLGLAAFAISVYWTYSNKGKTQDAEKKPTLAVIWERFPKFVLGFLAASLLFTFLSPTVTDTGTVRAGWISEDQLKSLSATLKSVQLLWFVLAFTSIGLETKFSDLFNAESRKPLYAFLIAQLFNIIVTLIIAFILFNNA